MVKRAQKESPYPKVSALRQEARLIQQILSRFERLTGDGRRIVAGAIQRTVAEADNPTEGGKTDGRA